uniref:UMP-CMP kinase 2, mitochondrial n=1 Tax=Xenopus tropicalis TaxID=8364 RepID=A0A803J9M7_XENTR
MLLGRSAAGLLSRLVATGPAVGLIPRSCFIAKTHSRIMSTYQSHCGADWGHRVFAVDASPSLGHPEPFYFTALHSKDQASANCNEWPMLAHGGTALSVGITDPHPVSAARLHRALGQQLAQVLPATCQLLRLLSYLPQEPHTSLQRGFFIWDPHNCSSTQHKLKHLLREHRQHSNCCTYTEGPQGEIWQTPLELGSQTGPSRVVRVGEPDPSPFALNILLSAVYYSLSSARTVLQECSACIPEATRILELLDQCDTGTKKGRYPVIVIEGLDATGKSTLTESLRDCLKATLLRSPPDCISKWRKTFDDEPSLIKRAYYAAGNYIGACEIAKASMDSPVIVDRYWHSTAAYAIATEIGGNLPSLPHCGHDIYQWPQDLLRPDLVILLTVSDEERMLRMRGRGLEETKEEKELESNTMFRLKPQKGAYWAYSLPLHQLKSIRHGEKISKRSGVELAVIEK